MQDFVRAFQEVGGAAAADGEVGTAPPDVQPAPAGETTSEYRTMVVVLASVLGGLLLLVILGALFAVRQWRRVAKPIISVRPAHPSASALRTRMYACLHAQIGNCVGDVGNLGNARAPACWSLQRHCLCSACCRLATLCHSCSSATRTSAVRNVWGWGAVVQRRQQLPRRARR